MNLSIKKHFSIFQHPLFWVLSLLTLNFIPGFLKSGIYSPPFPKTNDAIRIIYFFFEYFHQELSQGRLPLWNPYLFSGVPFLAEPQSSIFYPFNILFFLPLELDLSYKINLLVHILFAAYGMYHLCRILGASREGASFGALAFAFNAQFTLFVFSGWIHVIRVACWTPSVLWSLVAASRAPDFRSARKPLALGVIFFALQTIGGHPEWLYYTGVTFLGLTIHELITMKQRRSHILLVAFLILGLGGMMGAIQLMPTVKAALNSTRGQAALARMITYEGFSFPTLFLPAILIPKLYGPWNLQLSVDSWLHKVMNAGISIDESTLYAGVLTLLLAGIAVKDRRNFPTFYFWFVLAWFGLLMALNDITHLKAFLDKVFPPQGMFRNPSRCIYWSCISLCVLSSFGATALLERKIQLGRALRQFLWGMGALSVVMAFTLWLGAPFWYEKFNFLIETLPAAQNEKLHAFGISDFALSAIKWGASQIFIFAGLLILNLIAIKFCAAKNFSQKKKGFFLIILLYVDLLIFAWPFLTSLEQPARYYQDDIKVLHTLAGDPNCRVFVEDDLFFRSGPNIALKAGFRSSTGYNTFHLKSYAEFAYAAKENPDKYWPALNACVKITGSGFHKANTPEAVIDQQSGVTHYSQYLPRVYFSNRVIPADDWLQAVKKIPQLMEPITPVILAKKEIQKYPIIEGSFYSTDVPILHEAPGSIAVQVKAPTDGWLTLNEIYYPSWKARIDGKVVSVNRINGIMQGIYLEKGSHEVVFYYSWVSFKIALTIGLLAFCILLGILFYPFRKNSKQLS